MELSKNKTNKYDDIINFPHHISKKHPQMSIEARSAQFAPFAALTGFNDEIKETERLVDKKILLSEDEKIKINDKLSGIESENIIGTLENQGNRISTLEDNMSNYLLTSKYEEEIGEVNSLFEGYSFYDKAPTLVNLIGDQEKASREIDRLLKYLNSEYDDVTPGTNKQIYSINENVSAIADAIIRIGGYEDMKHSNLVSRIKALEDKIL